MFRFVLSIAPILYKINKKIELYALIFFIHIYILAVPLPPSNLILETFGSIVLSITMQGIGTTPFVLQVPGIEALWEGPERGVCDCYDVQINPPHGRVARPAMNDRVS